MCWVAQEFGKWPYEVDRLPYTEVDRMVRFLTYKAELSNPDRSPAKVPPRGKVVFQMKGTGETQQQIYERMKKKVGSKSG